MLDRTVAPPFVQAKTFDLPGVQQVKVNGADLFIARNVQQEVIKIEFLFHGGRWFEDQAGLSHFTAHMLEKGTQTKTSTELADAFDRLGAHVEISPGYDDSSVNLFSLGKNWKEAFGLMMEMIRFPSFSGEELELMKSIFLQNLKVNLEKNSFVASQLIRKNVFGETHPYGTSIEEKDVAKIEQRGLVAYHKAKFFPFALFVTAGQSFDETEFGKALAAFSSATSVESSAREVNRGMSTETVDKPGSVQTSIRMGKRSIRRTHPEYFDLLLFNHILGGYFGSRLMKNIREEKGLTYGIYSSLNPLQRDSFLAIGADVNKENRDLALNEIKSEIRKLRTERISSEELETARNHFLGSLQSEVANPFSATDKIKNIFVNQLPQDYYQKLFQRIGKITPEDLIRVGEEHFHEESLRVVTVG